MIGDSRVVVVRLSSSTQGHQLVTILLGFDLSITFILKWIREHNNNQSPRNLEASARNDESDVVYIPDK